MSIRKVQVTNLFSHVGCGHYLLRHLQKVKHKKGLGFLTGLNPPLSQTSYWVPLAIEITKLQCCWFQSEGEGEGEVCTGDKGPIQLELISVSIKHGTTRNISTTHPPTPPPQDGMLVHRKVISQHFMRLPWQITSTHLYSSVNKKCFAQEHSSLIPKSQTWIFQPVDQHPYNTTTSPTIGFKVLINSTRG